MEIAKTIADARKFVAAARKQGKAVGFVPTMGALHVGHISLFKAARSQTDFVAVSIFVNPTQFGPNEDFDKYPRPIEDDLRICREQGVDLVFAPQVNEMYPTQNITWVNVEQLTDSLCGRSRPGHFRGVTTVCAKLFNIIQPDIAFFGQKDAQQCIVIKRMVTDLNMPLKIQICDTIREDDGLAVSSRNKYLNDAERKAALLIYKSLLQAKQLVESGIGETKKIIAEMKKTLAMSELLAPEYIEIVEPETLKPLESAKGRVFIAVAACCGSTRLIDNILVDSSGN
ncbi:MAG: pantoate--beta-alanine ligase [Phycisphaerae bacterium]|jgi:pantoate--beta-alanine ligase